MHIHKVLLLKVDCMCHLVFLSYFIESMKKMFCLVLTSNFLGKGPFRVSGSSIDNLSVRTKRNFLRVPTEKLIVTRLLSDNLLIKRKLSDSSLVRRLLVYNVSDGRQLTDRLLVSWQFCDNSLQGF